MLTRTSLRITLALALAVLAYTAFGFLAAPPLVKRAIQNQGSEALGRAVSVGEVRINPFLLTASVQGLSIAGLPGAPPVFDLAEVHADLSSASLIRRGFVLSELRVVSPALRMARTGPNRYDISDVLDRLAARPKGEPARMLLERLEVRNGSIDFDDRPEGVKHAVRDLTLDIPFISSLPDLADQFVEPKFSAVVNGGRVDLSGRVKPFSDTHETSLEVQLAGVELPRYVEYLPFPLGGRLESGVLEGRVKLGFRQAKQQTSAFGLSGQLTVRKLDLRDAAGEPLLAIPKAEVEIASLDLLGRSLVLEKARLENPRVHLRRGSDGRLNLAAPGAQEKPAQEKPSANPPESPDASRAAKQGAGRFVYELRAIELAGGELVFTDQAVEPAFSKTFGNVAISATGLTNQEGKAADVRMSFDTREGEKALAAASVALAPVAIDGSFVIGDVSLPSYASYYAAALPVAVQSATAKASGKFRFASGPAKPGADKDGDAAGMRVTELMVALADVRLRHGDDDFVRLATLEMEGGDINPAARSVSLRTLSARDGRVSVRRNAAGVLSVAQLASAGKTQPDAGPDWSVSVAKAATSGIVVAWEDAAAPSPVKLEVGPISLSAESYTSRPGSSSRVSASLSLGGKGTLSIAGPVQLKPLAAKLDIQAKGLPVDAFHPYFAHLARINIAGGAISARGTLNAEDGRFDYRGQAELADVSLTSRGGGEPMLEWASLAFNGLEVRSQPFSARASEVALGNFYARVVVLPEGRLSLQDVLPGGEQPRAAPAAVKPEAVAADTAKNAAPRAARPDVAVDRFTLRDGTVDFTDLFVKPNFSAHLTQLGGQVTGLSADPATRAKVELTARIEQTAPVSISGTVNPLADDLSLDLTAAVKGYDLNLLSTYAAKYVGYGIEKGKLSLDLRYRLENRKLEAENRIFLDQLTFGRPVESPNALQLPVLLAVKLLQNSRGEIDVSVPISGSLDDPQFSMGEIIIKIIGNMIVRTITAPFAFLGSLFGGGGEQELSWIGFEPGRDDITAEAEGKMDTLAKALLDRPQLTLEIAARVAAAADSEGLKRRRLEAQLLPAARGGAQPVARVPAAEYPKLLRQRYEQEKARLPAANKAAGKDSGGTAGEPTAGKEPTVEEMEKLLLARITVTSEDLLGLATRRGIAVQNRLSGKGIPGERMFLVSPGAAPAEEQGEPGGEERREARKKAPEARVDLYLK